MKFFHSKYISPFLTGFRPSANFSCPAGVDQIWKKFEISGKMTSMVPDIAREKYGNREALRYDVALD